MNNKMKYKPTKRMTEESKDDARSVLAIASNHPVSK